MRKYLKVKYIIWEGVLKLNWEKPKKIQITFFVIGGVRGAGISYFKGQDFSSVHQWQLTLSSAGIVDSCVYSIRLGQTLVPVDGEISWKCCSRQMHEQSCALKASSFYNKIFSKKPILLLSVYIVDKITWRVIVTEVGVDAFRDVILLCPNPAHPDRVTPGAGVAVRGRALHDNLFWIPGSSYHKTCFITNYDLLSKQGFNYVTLLQRHDMFWENEVNNLNFQLIRFGK